MLQIFITDISASTATTATCTVHCMGYRDTACPRPDHESISDMADRLKRFGVMCESPKAFDEEHLVCLKYSCVAEMRLKLPTIARAVCAYISLPNMDVDVYFDNCLIHHYTFISGELTDRPTPPAIRVLSANGVQLGYYPNTVRAISCDKEGIITVTVREPRKDADKDVILDKFEGTGLIVQHVAGRTSTSETPSSEDPA